MGQASEHTEEEEEVVHRKLRASVRKLRELEGGGERRGGGGKEEGGEGEEGERLGVSVDDAGGEGLSSQFRSDGCMENGGFRSNFTGGDINSSGRVKNTQGKGMPEIELSNRRAAGSLPEIEHQGKARPPLAASVALEPEIKRGGKARPSLTASVALDIGARWESNTR